MKRSGFRRKNKYGAVKTMCDGILFASKLEAEHYEDLKIRQIVGEIKDLVLQHEMVVDVNNKRIAIYIADYFYFDIAAQNWVVSDAKGVETDVFRIKWKLVQAIYPAFIYEIRKKYKITRTKPVRSEAA